MRAPAVPHQAVRSSRGAQTVLVIWTKVCHAEELRITSAPPLIMPSPTRIPDSTGLPGPFKGFMTQISVMENMPRFRWDNATPFFFCASRPSEESQVLCWLPLKGLAVLFARPKPRMMLY